MVVEVQVTVRGSRKAVWDAASDIENAARIVSGIEKIEVVEKPAAGLVGLKWRETRMFRGAPETIEKWITDATEQEFYKTRAEGQGFLYLSTVRVAEGSGGTMLTSCHESEPQTFAARLMTIPMSLLFKGMLRKALLQDLNDIKSAVEKA